MPAQNKGGLILLPHLSGEVGLGEGKLSWAVNVNTVFSQALAFSLRSVFCVSEREPGFGSGERPGPVPDPAVPSAGPPWATAAEQRLVPEAAPE